MPTHYIARRATVPPGAALPHAAPIYVDTDDNKLKMIPAGSGTTEVEIVDASSVQTLTNKTLTSPASTGSVLTTPAGVVVAQETLFTEIAGNKTHTASFTIPAGATIQDIIVTNTTVWNSGTSATLKIGIQGGDDDCFFTGVDLKTIPAAGKSINFAFATGHGASVPAIDGGGTTLQLGATSGFLYSATAQVVDAIVTDVNVAGTNGRTRVTVLYSLPPSIVAPVVA